MITYPGDQVTYLFGALLIAWTLFGMAYTSRMARRVRRLRRTYTLYMQAALTSDTEGERAHGATQVRAGMDRADAMDANTRRWLSRVYTPIMLALALPTLLFSLWAAYRM